MDKKKTAGLDSAQKPKTTFIACADASGGGVYRNNGSKNGSYVDDKGNVIQVFPHHPGK